MELAMHVVTPGTHLEVKVKLKRRVWRVIKRTRCMMRGIREVLVDRIETVAWLSQ